jgi:hypothetical protein
VIPLDEAHLRGLLRDFVRYHHQDRGPVEQKPSANAVVISIPRLGGLHHRYAGREAA